MDQITSHVLRDAETEITVLSMGAAVMDWRVRGRPVVLGYAEPEHYRHNPAAMGAICGRVANRIAGACFEMEGVRYPLPANAGPHHLHGGPGGLGLCNWRMTPDGDRRVALDLVSKDGDQGYPGTVTFHVLLTLEEGRLTWVMEAVPDRRTPINLAQHLYFNLSGAGTVMDHHLRVAAEHYTPNGPDLVPLGQIAPVAGTEYDFRTPKRLGDGPGWDGNVVLSATPGPAAEVVAPDDLRLRLWTDRPGLQIYTSNTLSPTLPKGAGAAHQRFAGLCLEAQDFPNAVNEPSFGSIFYTPEAPYRQVTSIEIG